MKRITSKYQVIVMGNSQIMPQFYCENTAVPITEDLEMLCVTIDDEMKFERQIANVSQESLPAETSTVFRDMTILQ